MKHLLLVFSILQCFVISVFAQNLIFEENFNDFNRTRWMHLITAWRGGNSEFQYYTNRPENSYVKNGMLFIKPTLTADRFDNNFLYSGTLDLNKEGCNINWENGCSVTAGAEIINPIQSARLVTSNSFSFTYGTVEVRAKMPRGDWIWPAIWMLPTDSAYGSWPRSGEIDIVEIRGNADLTCNDGQGKIGNSKMFSTLHWGPGFSQNMFQKTSWAKSLTDGSTFSSGFHVYRFEWLSTGITFKVDGQVIGSVSPPAGGFWELSGLTGTNPWASGTKMAPFDKIDFTSFLMLLLEVIFSPMAV
ncbi:beta-1,3-glucan-binding protein-like [Daphnia pulicaria]|uniref:beta-1,3-glucan-binding protein-like n=1 Tax=Daphnia pulicaria TaxID=35523 RepID=UPI001EEA6125|nr:beta-1,3-glucan-binding protein-like [Daphnia pulicaria]